VGEIWKERERERERRRNILVEREREKYVNRGGLKCGRVGERVSQ
jgi:hypothetical protein